MTLFDFFNSETLIKNFKNDFLNNKIMKKDEKVIFLKYFAEKKYLIQYEEYFLKSKKIDYPILHKVYKSHKDKMRILFSFEFYFNLFLKLINYYLFLKYDSSFCECLYSFRKKQTIRKALDKLKKLHQNNNYTYKTDISDYFNSIRVDYLLLKLESILLNEDNCLLKLFKEILTNDFVIYRNKVTIYKNKGAMAGIPISNFFANLYLNEVDHYFKDNNITYVRYADDIIIFSTNYEELLTYVNILHKFISNLSLKINLEKDIYTKPNDPWTFLGIKVTNCIADLTPHSFYKIKKYIKHRGIILRNKIENGYDKYKAVNYFLRGLNKYFYIKNRFDKTWSRWYFPLLDTTKTLKNIDNYIAINIGYILNGNYKNKNLAEAYKLIKTTKFYYPLKYRYYKFKEK